MSVPQLCGSSSLVTPSLSLFPTLIFESVTFAKINDSSLFACQILFELLVVAVVVAT